MGISFKKNGVIHKYGGYASADIYVSDKYSPTKTYNPGEYCIYKNRFWKKIGAAEKGITPTEGTSWTETKLSKEVSSYVEYITNYVEEEKLQLNTDSALHTKVSAHNVTIRRFANGIKVIYGSITFSETHNSVGTLLKFTKESLAPKAPFSPILATKSSDGDSNFPISVTSSKGVAFYGNVKQFSPATYYINSVYY